ncbi:cerebellar degeneration-related protein 2-like isoform X2 [Episyrphus balteatus]|uniref:cerebellar degeneration-related protein 2-like isoform X2 n=1 Tax=Episyrphus balteatus TaxID=286459 RepID=UPI0024864C0A|nr:cerebellar degeneration-related protein 2-like isoform X2 [Episyrphus balteatus]XP_055846444.1 cerebellar degeneration-related protein 2-like isoform X2 [Episyrphus balteatus]
MATHKELSFDWSILYQDYDQWTKTDLQLAAELGKTLLERNKELETTLKHHQNIIDDQAQEIIYLQKQTAALREVNDSRLKIYEQLEVGVQELERSNHRLNVENNNHKKHVKTLVHNIETLECRCEELTKSIEETKQTLTIERRKNERLLQEKNNAGNDQMGVRLRHHEKEVSNNSEGETEIFHANTTNPENCSFAFLSSSANNKNANSTGISDSSHNESVNISVDGVEDNEELIRVISDLESTKKALLSEQQRVGELEDQLVAIIQENQTLQGRLVQGSNEEMKSVHEELSILEEVRQGNMCSRCLRACDERLTVHDEASSIAPTEEDDDRSLLDMEAVGGGTESNGDTSSQVAYHRSAVTIKVASRLPQVSLDLNAPASPNPYRDLVEKYEALLEVQRHSVTRKSGGVSLADEFQSSGDFTSLHMKDNSDKNSLHQNQEQENTQNNRSSKNNRRTPTEFSEAETSSSGFSDETSNKGTQTDDRPGYFLCSIGDGEDCKFSIYDDASPIDSRFRNRPEYRELFKEIFAVLKKAAENKEEGDKLPLLDDTHPPVAAKVPPVTPANEEMPSMDFADDAQSIISSAISEQSFAMSECITKMERKTAKKHIIEKNQENQPPCASLSGSTTLTPASKQAIIENGRVLTPLKREPLEYLMVGVGIKKKSKKKNRNYGTDRSESPAALPSPPRVYYSSGKKRRDMRPFNHSPSTSSGTPVSSGQSHSRRPNLEWNGNSMIIYNRGVNSATSSPRGPIVTPRGRELDLNGVEFRPSTVSQDLHKLKKLDLSYAEVLRRADACKQPYHRRK